MELLSLYALLGFMLASYSVIANDSVQTLGTFIASNSEKFKWYYLAYTLFSCIVWYINYMVGTSMVVTLHLDD